MPELKVDSTRRFSSRVENYIKFRPGYPPAIIDLLARECGLTHAQTIADIGSGTGILSELWLKNGNPVFGVEPNLEMRGASIKLLRSYPQFRPVDGKAEATTLPSASVDLITAGQSFHWFDREPTRHEFARILKPGGHVALIWNDRHTSQTPFFQGYEELLAKFGTDYAAVNHKHTDAKIIGSFFGPPGYRTASFPNEQRFHFESLKGRLLSSSYAPELGHPQHEPMITALRELFQQHQEHGFVTFGYDTMVYYGQLG